MKVFLQWLQWRRFDSHSSPAQLEDQTEPTHDEIRALNAFYYGVATTRLNSQFSYIRQIDAKSTSYFTIGSTVLPIVAGFVSTDNSRLLDDKFAVYALFAGFFCYLLLAIFYVLSLIGGKWIQVPDMEQFKTISAQFAVEDLQRALGDAFGERLWSQRASD